MTRNVARGDNSGHIVQVGAVHGDVNLGDTGGRARLPYRFGLIPGRTSGFQTRDVPELATESVVLSGMGGVGKTQLAADHARHSEAALVAWITASSRDQVQTEYARLAELLTGTATPRHLLEWLNTNPNWLIVLDDLQSPADLAGLWPSETGQTVVTTRRRDAVLRGGNRKLVHVGLFSPAESAAYLAEMLAEQPHLRPGIAELADVLGHLPLALGQAAVYIADREITCTEYLRRWRERHLSQLFPDVLPDERHDTIATTWSMSVDHANALAPTGLAGPILRVAALLDPNGIPLAVLTAPAVLTHLSAAAERPITADDARDALSCLHRTNLMTLDTSPSAAHVAVRVHALVQLATRHDIEDAQWPGLVKVTADALLHAWPPARSGPAALASIYTNTAALLDVGAAHLYAPQCHPVLFRAGHNLGQVGRPADARAYFADLAATARMLLGGDHVDVLAARHGAANWQAEAGDVAGALTAMAELLADEIRVLGPDHPDTLGTRADLGNWRAISGDPAGAVAALAELLADQTRVLGPDAVDTLNTRHSLALWQGESADTAAALSAAVDLLADYVRVLGPDHPDILSVRSNVARCLGNNGDAEGARAMLAELLTDYLRDFGPDHPETLTTRNNLADWQGEAGDPAGARAAFGDLLADRLRVLGPEHPHTRGTQENLDHWQRVVDQRA
ncbi:tetratricopeptide repeat protein [Actinokineospora sp. NBRC 105648]|uniref:tetratricopeptide repeat protein n=1 Tax=Actinokineospora sp. NBRC 105648 TaxID=3032206 RepID=UPI00255210BD|nr:tetratricopeptide repeat protein [Actinokineospora sp. NBRC 105648]